MRAAKPKLERESSPTVRSASTARRLGTFCAFSSTRAGTAIAALATLIQHVPFLLARLSASYADSYVSRRRKEGASDRTIYKELVALRVALKLARRAGKWHGAPEAILPVGFKADYLPRNRFLRIEELEKLLHELVPEHAARVAFIVATSANWRESELALRGDVAEDFSTVLLRSATRCSPIFASRTAVPVQQTCSKLLQVLHSLHLLHPLSPLNQRARRELNPRPSDSKSDALSS